MPIALLQPVPAHACGACVSAVPPPPPGQQNNQYVAQDAERVLFLRNETIQQTTVWVEVRYSGAASDFGWVLPLPKQPKVGVGSRLLFDRLDKATAPVFETTYAGTENCHNPQDGCVQFPRSFADAAMSSEIQSPGPDESDAAGGATNADVTVLDAGATGPYDYVVLVATTVDPLHKWLNDHGYKTPDKAKPILQSHIAKGDVFVAIKLSNGAGIDQIRPIVLAMDNAEPCVPLRLTSIAAAEEMTVVVTVAGKGRAIPKNALHVQVNPMRLNWYAGASNDAQVVSAALDEAAGNGFVTEFSNPPQGIIDPLFSPNGIIDPLFLPQTQTGLGLVTTLKTLGVWAESTPGGAETELADDIEALTLFGKLHGLTAGQAFAVLAYCGGATSGVDWQSQGCTTTVNGKQLKLDAKEAATPVDGKALLASAKDHFFQPLTGWHDGQLPPDAKQADSGTTRGDTARAPDGGSTGEVAAGKDTGAAGKDTVAAGKDTVAAGKDTGVPDNLDGASAADAAPAKPAAPPSRSDSGCSSGPGGGTGAAWLWVILLGMWVARRRAA